MIRETWYDHAGNKVKGEDGYVTRLRVMSGNRTTSVAWLDEEGNGIPIGDDLYYRVEYTYDKAGNVNREKYYDQDGQPMLCRDGYAIVYREFDKFNRVVYEKYFGTDGFATTLEDGAVSRRFEYDDDGNLIRTTKYDYADHEVN